MYSFLRGSVAFIDGAAVALDVGGVGYKVFTTQRSLEAASADAGEMLFYTVLIVKEDELSIYGFETMQEKKIFEKLISVSGIGPKAGMAILSQMTAGEIAQALMVSDVKAFSRVSGIGPKTAGRIILELKDKVDIEDALADPAVATGGITPQTEAAEALMGLGYTRVEAVSAVAAVSALADTAEDITLLALKRLAM